MQTRETGARGETARGRAAEEWCAVSGVGPGRDRAGPAPANTTYALAGRERTGPAAPSDAPVSSVAAPPGRLRRPAPQARRRSTRIRTAARRSRGSRFNRSSPLRLRPLTHAPAS